MLFDDNLMVLAFGLFSFSLSRSLFLLSSSVRNSGSFS